MYIDFAIYLVFLKLYYRLHDIPHKSNLEYVRILSKEQNAPFLLIITKMIWSLLVTGASFSEYYNLDFYHRPLLLQRTFITTGSNWRAYKRYNNASFNHVFINKTEFNTVYAEFIKRKWIPLTAPKELIYEFFSKHSEIIIKPNDGDSGNGIFVVRDCLKLNKSDIDALIRKNKKSIAEEILHNHPVIDKLNSTSLNTMRIITIRLKNRVSILFAGIRYGTNGECVDNISRGGRVAVIDINNGVICTKSSVKKTEVSVYDHSESFVGFQIPMWEDLLPFLERLTNVTPEMKYMAWDIAVLPEGFAVIEGNHSSGNTIHQAHIPITEHGHRTEFLKIITREKNEKIADNKHTD